MTEVFDPEKVERFSDREASHMGWRERITVSASDYDKLLALYREAVKPPRRAVQCAYCGRVSQSGTFHEQQCNAPIGYIPS